jgi:hypothetical protein
VAKRHCKKCTGHAGPKKRRRSTLPSTESSLKTVLDSKNSKKEPDGEKSEPLYTDAARYHIVSADVSQASPQAESDTINAEMHTCALLPHTSVVFGVPTTSTNGATGSLSNAYEYGDCVGKVGYESHRTVAQGVEVSVGFK